MYLCHVETAFFVVYTVVHIVYLEVGYDHEFVEKLINQFRLEQSWISAPESSPDSESSVEDLH